MVGDAGRGPPPLIRRVMQLINRVIQLINRLVLQLTENIHWRTMPK